MTGWIIKSELKSNAFCDKKMDGCIRLLASASPHPLCVFLIELINLNLIPFPFHAEYANRPTTRRSFLVGDFRLHLISDDCVIYLRIFVTTIF